MMMNTPPIHPLGTQARILLSSVFGPYAQDDQYGSRKINPMELYHNQVTRVQGVYSLRMFHRSFSLLMIQANIDAPCTVLDFPSLDRFIREVKTHSYDIIGVSSIGPNIGKVKAMCRLIREYQPNATVLVGGHIASMENLDKMVEVDRVVRGDGIRWLRKFIGQDPEAPVKHPMAYSAFGARILGVTLRDRPGDVAAILIPSVGCPIGCNFCSTSALFGGKGRFINFYKTGDELFDIMCDMERKLKVRSFFILDENFLLHRRRALRLLELMQDHQKGWALNVFSSARVIKSYTMEQLVGLGIIWVWMGLEGKDNHYRKLNDIDTRKLVRKLQNHGIRVLGSTIIGLENHTPENMPAMIDHAISHKTDFHQFMLYTPNPGTPLYETHKQAGTLFDESDFSLADAHGQYRFNYRHSHIANGMEGRFLIDAFTRDFESNGPSLGRLIRTMLKGWQRYQNHPDKRIRERYRWDSAPIRTTYAGAVWAMKKRLGRNRAVHHQLKILLKDLYREFGWKTRVMAPLIGIFCLAAMINEERRLTKGRAHEPDTFYEKNDAALVLEQAEVVEKKKAVRMNFPLPNPAPGSYASSKSASG
ncbi:MAG: cobalamin-dependent protein [Thermodesulfobacteriota bacterium]|nr:cobalamin-dependent protein [Thermodesulfobacteriota bacterium]